METNKLKKRHSFLGLFALTLFVAGVIFFCHAFSAVPLNAMEEKNFGTVTEKGAGRQLKNTASDSRLQKKCQEIYQKNKKLLVLVNRQKALSKNYDPVLRTICNGRLMASSLLYDDLREMLADAGNAGYQYWFASAWRSREKQQKLVDEDVRALVNKGMAYAETKKEVYKETQPAGHSEHETGLALDILCSGNMEMTLSQEQEPGNQWLQENSWKYGFILRYPKDKEDLTQISYEPWHFRYVGKEAADLMYHHNLCLEGFHRIRSKSGDKTKK